MRNNFLLYAIILIIFAGCDESPTSVFPLAESQGIDESMLESAYDAAEEIFSLQSLLVSRNGVLVAERYFHGAAADSFFEVRSVTKSVMSILIGIAIEQGIIPGTNQSIGPYLLPLVDEFDTTKNRVTIEHLLTMSGGFEWAPFGDWSEYNRWVRASNQTEYVMNKPLVHEPGTVFNYNDGASHLLSVILTEVAGISTAEYAYQHLFSRMAMAANRDWLQDRQGYERGSTGFHVTARGMIKIGELYLNQGVHKGIQVVPKAWVLRSTQPLIPTLSNVIYGAGYGYLWWVDTVHSHHVFYANGFGGQFIFVVPDLALVVTATNVWQNQRSPDENWYNTLRIIAEQILPAVH
jgi:CubicO group peptidase (beta-lactamase class C family)